MQKIFVCEFITCGGMRGSEIPAGLLVDAEAMLRALLGDLAQVSGLSVHTCRDDRLSPLEQSSRQVRAADNVTEIWKELITESDLVWLIAPESDNKLLELSRLVQSCGTPLISSSDEAIRLTSSKMATYQTLRTSGLLQPETRFLEDEAVSSDSGWVVKPNMGAGGQHCYFTSNLSRLRAEKKLPQKEKYFVQQAFLEGTHLSLSVIYSGEKTFLLSCNSQEILVENNELLNRVIDHECSAVELESLQQLAEDIYRHIPGLRAYVGIDLLCSGNDVYILDINPRLTSAYAGLSESLGYNVAEFIIEKFRHMPLTTEAVN